jgi:MFS family permease
MRDSMRGWLVVGGCVIGGIFSLPSVFFNVLPALTVPIEQATGWSRESIQAGIGVHILGSFLAVPLCGYLVDRMGARAVILISQILFAIGLAAISFTASSIALFYASFVLLAFLGTGTGPVAYAKIVVDWFTTHRGLALGISVMGVGAAGGLLALMVTALTAEVGWTGALQVMAAITALMVVPLFFLLKDYPTPAESVAVAATHGATDQESAGRFWFMRSREFWLLAAAFLIAGIGQIGIVFNLIPMQIDRGMTPVAAAGVQAVIGGALVVGRLIGGLLLDRVESPKIASWGLILAAIGLIWLGSGITGWQAYAAAALLGLSAGIETDVLPYMISRYFDAGAFGRIFAIIATISQLAIAVSPFMMSSLRTQTGDYAASCFLGAGLVVLAGALLWLLPRYRYAARPLSPAS